MATIDTPNNEMTVAIKKGDQIDVPVHENTSVEAAAPTNDEITLVSDTGIDPETTTRTEQLQLETNAAPIPEQQQLAQPQLEETVVADLTNHVPASEVSTDVDTSAMIAEAAAAAVFAVGDVQLAVDAALAADRNNNGGDAAAAVAAVAAAVKNEAMNVADNAAADLDAIDAETKKNEQRRKRYREKSVEDEVPPPSKKQASTMHSHEDQLASRRMKDRERYASMTPEQRHVYNAKRREQYHRQSEASRQRRRERERERYHSLENEDAKQRNARRAKLERERYQRLNPDQLESKNRKRRERAASSRNKKSQDRNVGDDSDLAEMDADGTEIDAGSTVSIMMVPAENSTATTNATVAAASIIKVQENAASNIAVETSVVPVVVIEQPQQQQVVEIAAVEAAAVAAVAAAEVEKQGDNATDQAAVEAAVEAVDNHISV